MTAATYRVTWDDVPQIGGDFATVFAAMAHGQREYEYTAYDPMEDLGHITPTMSWRLGWASRGSDRTRLWLYDSDTRTAVHIDPVTVPPIDITTPKVLTHHECPLCPYDVASVTE